MDHRTQENCLVLEQKVMFDRSWKVKLLSAHSDFLIYMVLSIILCSRAKYVIMKKIERDAIFSRSF